MGAPSHGMTSVSNEGIQTGLKKNKNKKTRRAEVPVTAGTRATCVPRLWHRSSATGCGLASRLWHRRPRAGRQRPQGIPAVTDMLHYGYYFAVWPKGGRRRGWESGFIVFQGSEEAFMSERRGSKPPPLACLLVSLRFLFF